VIDGRFIAVEQCAGESSYIIMKRVRIRYREIHGWRSPVTLGSSGKRFDIAVKASAMYSRKRKPTRAQ